MTRGIHLKHLTAADLGLLGLPEELLGEGHEPLEAVSLADADGEAECPTGQDALLLGITRDVRVTLEEALTLLDQALAIGQQEASLGKRFLG